MSSAIYISREGGDPVSGTDWQAFCDEHDLAYSPQTIGGNVWYAGDVEVTVRRDGVTFSTYHLGGAMPQVAAIAAAFWTRFGGAVTADPEFILGAASVADRAMRMLR